MKGVCCNEEAGYCSKAKAKEDQPSYQIFRLFFTFRPSRSSPSLSPSSPSGEEGFGRCLDLALAVDLALDLDPGLGSEFAWAFNFGEAEPGVGDVQDFGFEASGEGWAGACELGLALTDRGFAGVGLGCEASESMQTSPSASTAVAVVVVDVDALPLPLFAPWMFPRFGRAFVLAEPSTSLALTLQSPLSSAKPSRTRFLLPRGLAFSSRVPWQLGQSQETSLSSCKVESARNRARFASVVCFPS